MYSSIFLSFQALSKCCKVEQSVFRHITGYQRRGIDQGKLFNQCILAVTRCTQQRVHFFDTYVLNMGLNVTSGVTSVIIVSATSVIWDIILIYILNIMKVKIYSENADIYILCKRKLCKCKFRVRSCLCELTQCLNAQHLWFYPSPYSCVFDNRCIMIVPRSQWTVCGFRRAHLWCELHSMVKMSWTLKDKVVFYLTSFNLLHIFMPLHDVHSQLINYIEQNWSWEAKICFTTQISSPIWNPVVCYHVHKSLQDQGRVCNIF